MAVVDVYDALASKRPYRLPLPPGECGVQLLDEVEKGWWNGQVVEALIEVLETENLALEGPEVHATPLQAHGKIWL